MRGQYQAEKGHIDKQRGIQKELDEARQAIDDAERRYDLGRVAELRYGIIPELEQKLQDAQKQTANESGMLTERVGEEEIAEIVSRWTGVPLSRLSQDQGTRLLKLEDRLRDRVIGQDHAIEAVSQAILRSRAGLAPAQRPNGSFSFLAPLA